VEQEKQAEVDRDRLEQEKAAQAQAERERLKSEHKARAQQEQAEPELAKGPIQAKQERLEQARHAHEVRQAEQTQISRIVNTFIAPTKTFTDLRRSAAWWGPGILISIVSLLFVYTVQRQVTF